LISAAPHLDPSNPPQGSRQNRNRIQAKPDGSRISIGSSDRLVDSGDDDNLDLPHNNRLENGSGNNLIISLQKCIF
jgi:hypothetical protein